MSTFDLSKMSTRELLALWAQSLRELRDREVVRTFNNPIGDIAEALVALHYGGERGSTSTSRSPSTRSSVRPSCCSPFGDRLAAAPVSGLWS